MKTKFIFLLFISLLFNSININAFRIVYDSYSESLRNSLWNDSHGSTKTKIWYHHESNGSNFFKLKGIDSNGSPWSAEGSVNSSGTFSGTWKYDNSSMNGPFILNFSSDRNTLTGNSYYNGQAFPWTLTKYKDAVTALSGSWNDSQSPTDTQITNFNPTYLLGDYSRVCTISGKDSNNNTWSGAGWLVKNKIIGSWSYDNSNMKGSFELEISFDYNTLSGHSYYNGEVFNMILTR